MLSPLEELDQALAAALARHDSDSAYTLLARFVANVNALPAAAGAVLESAELDAWCARLAALVGPGGFSGVGLVGDAEAQVYLVTELYAVGGHTGVIRDFIRVQPGRRHHLLITDIHGKTDRGAVERAFAAENVHCHWAEAGASPTARAAWLLAALRFFEAARVFLFTHHEDAVAISAVMAARHPRVFFYHHADHSLSLGMHLPGSTHLDLSSYSLGNCRDALGIPNCLYVPLISSEHAPRAASEFRQGADSADFVTCSAGNGGKFERPYLYTYAGVVARILGATGGRHLHIGDLSAEYLARVRREITDVGLDAARFVHIGRVPDLGAAMREYQVSLYVSSFPIGGAKAGIDVMATGTPVICHSHISNAYLGTQCYLYPEAGIWRHPDELIALIRALDPAALQLQSRLARAFWEKHHRPAALRSLLDSPGLTVTVEPPEMPFYRPDALRSVLAASGTSGDFPMLFSKLARLEKRLAKSERRNATLDARCGRLTEELDAVRKSKLWRLLAPFRRKSG